MKKILEKKVYIIITILFWLLTIILLNPFSSENCIVTIENNYNKTQEVTKELTTDDVIIQRFIAKENNLREIGIDSATYGRKSLSLLKIQIKDLTDNKIIFDHECPSNGLEDNKAFKIMFDNQENSKEREYEIVIKCLNGETGKSLSFWLGKDVDNNFKYNLNGTENDGSLILSGVYLNENIKIVNIIIWILVLIIALLVVVFLDGKLDEKNFLKIALFAGILSLIFIPYPHLLDEGTHFFRSYLIANGSFYDVKVDDEIGGMVSENYTKFINDKVNIKALFSDTSSLKENFNNEKVFYANKYLSSTIPIDHMIAAIGIFIGLVLKLNVYAVIILARICTLAFYIVFSYYAIKNMKYYKSCMFLIATLPVGLWLAGSVSLDPILHGAILLFTSICLKYFFDDNEESKIKIADIALIFITASMIISVKYLAYTPLLLLFFLIPKNKFKNTKQYILVITAAALVAILIVIWQFWMLNEFKYVEDRNAADFVDIGLQIEHILENPVDFIRMFASTIISSLPIHFADFSLYSAIPKVGGCASIILILAAILEKDKYSIKDNKKKIWPILLIAFIFLSTLIIIYLAEYLAYTPVGAGFIKGFQVRYFIPLLILLCIMIGEIMQTVNNIKDYEKKLLFIVFVLNLNNILGVIYHLFK